MSEETRILYLWLTNELEIRRAVERMSAEDLKNFAYRPDLTVKIVGNIYPIEKSFLSKVDWEKLRQLLNPARRATARTS